MTTARRLARVLSQAPLDKDEFTEILGAIDDRAESTEAALQESDDPNVKMFRYMWQDMQQVERDNPLTRQGLELFQGMGLISEEGKQAVIAQWPMQ